MHRPAPGNRCARHGVWPKRRGPPDGLQKAPKRGLGLVHGFGEGLHVHRREISCSQPRGSEHGIELVPLFISQAGARDVVRQDVAGGVGVKNGYVGDGALQVIRMRAGSAAHEVERGQPDTYLEYRSRRVGLGDHRDRLLKSKI